MTVIIIIILIVMIIMITSLPTWPLSSAENGDLSPQQHGRTLCGDTKYGDGNDDDDEDDDDYDGGDNDCIFLNRKNDEFTKS